jgi:dinuclear metal center YbgI/SA1388 family protein
MKTNRSTTRDGLVAYLDDYLAIMDIPDASPNGLQVQGRARVGKLAFAVDASVQTIRAAVKSRADMLIVHHGLFWGTHQQIVGNLYKRIAALIKADLSLYAVHLPLDCHQEIGNNVELARLLDLKVVGRFGDYHGVIIGTLAHCEKPLRRERLTDNINKRLEVEVDLLPFGPAEVRNVGIISGEAAKFAEDARRSGCDTLITGESSHTAYHMAKEAGINVIYGGHYATETVGLRALAEHLRQTLNLSCKFISAPTGY